MVRPLKRLLLLLLSLIASPAAAHLTPNSEIRLDFGTRAVEAEAIVPLPELGFALRRQVQAVLGPANDPEIRAYVAERLAVPGWRVRVHAIDIIHEVGPPDLRARFRLEPPPDASPRRFTLDYRVVIDRVPNHMVLIVARNDFAGGQVSAEPKLLGALQGAQTRLSVDRGAASDWKGFAAAVQLGMHHIAEGHDHLLFLVALLLPAPLLAKGRRWNGYAGLRHTARGLIAVVTAFTIGHSLTLIGGAFLGWQLPVQPVEVAIALSVLISAAHAWRPLFDGREAVVAALFGLVHGLAFATLIGHLGMEPAQKAKAILGFNIGIELIQLLVVAAVMPALIMLARTRFYTAVRMAGAALAGTAALAWLAERLFQVENPIASAIDQGLGYAPWLLALLSVAAATAFMLGRKAHAA